MKRFVAAMGHLNIDLIYGRMPRIPAEGEEVFSESLDLELGGGPAATLVNLHRLGIEAQLGTFLGRDFLSEFARRELDSYGLPYLNFFRGEGSPLTVTSIISTESDRTFVSHAFDEEGYAIPESELYELYRGCSVAYIGLGYDEVWRRLKREGAAIVLDSHWREDLSLGLYEEAFGYVDYFTPNQKEAERITGESDPRRSIELLAERVASPVVKLGAEGCLYREGGRTRHAPALRD
ncbi:MAG: carbohydrate kinase family protein, partial [Spirochaetaceae bacterium]|nr:carbohydrate kinase family protein [Spirochaetaceae bacterium]